jgi:hypothetical protein
MVVEKIPASWQSPHHSNNKLLHPLPRLTHQNMVCQLVSVLG